MKKVLIVKTGGTLVMKGEPLEPGDYSETLLEHVPEIAQLAEIESVIVSNIDSSDIDIEHWVTLIKTVAGARERYDGVVIIHGTDTMAYTASALAFGLEGIDFPVILTGSQRPLASVRSDARRNLADAVELATLSEITEVGICFDGVLLRGCRSSKVHGHAYHAFASPGVEPLATLGVDIKLSKEVRRPRVPFRAKPYFDENVIVAHLTPGLPPHYLEGLISKSSSTLRGIVLGTFGLGTVPTLSKPLAPVLKEAIEHGIDVVVVTPATGRVHLSAYQNSRVLADIGAISGGSMNYEAAVTKLMHAIARFSDATERREYLEWNVAGEGAMVDETTQA